jgi:mitochondrial fission protein ELM1
MSAAPQPRIWTLTDDAAGNRQQALALALALGGAINHVPLHFPQPWRALAPRLQSYALDSLPAASKRWLAPPWPDIAIGCGRQSALALRALKRSVNAPIFSVQILDPRIDPAAYDLVIAPRHDALTAPNVLNSLGALNAIDAAWLEAARRRVPALAELARPITTVLIGGSHRQARLDVASLQRLFQSLAAARTAHGGSVLVLASRRSQRALHAPLRALSISVDGRCWIDADDGDNPFASWLAYADRVVVSADSVNMLSEALALGVPVISHAAYGLRGKLARFDAALRERGLLSAWSDPPQAQTPLRETPALAAQVRQRWERSIADVDRRRAPVSRSR